MVTLARPLVRAGSGVVACGHPAAAVCGRDAFALGGGAVDAAIAAAYALAVLLPDACGLGGDGNTADMIHDIYAQIAYSLKSRDVEDVVIGGRVVMRARKLLTVDEPAVIEKARQYGAAVKKSLAME